MTSTIDATKPAIGEVPASSANLRANFLAAKNEITALQASGGGLAPTALTGAAIQAANDAIVASGVPGLIRLAAGATYVVTSPIVIECSKVGIIGNLATLDCSGISAGTGAAALTLTNTGGNYILPLPIEHFYLIGASGSGRDFDVVGLRLHSTTALSDVRVMVRGVFFRFFKSLLSIGNQAFLARFVDCEFLQGKFAVVQENVSTTYTLENVSFEQCAFYNSDCFVKALIGQQLHFTKSSFDFFGSRQTVDDHVFDIQGGGIVTLTDCHVEFSYGATAGDTNSPIRLKDANSKFIWHGGSLVYGSTAQNPAWTHFAESDNQTQVFTIWDVQCTQMGRKSLATGDDSWLRGPNVNALDQSGTCAKPKIRVFGEDNVVDQIPSVVCYQPAQGNPFRNGVDDPFAELGWRTAITGTTAVATATAENGITPRNSATNMMKFTGTGKAIIALPVMELNRQHAWAFFVNGGATTGSFTIRERLSGETVTYDGTTFATVADPRASYSGTTVTITGGTNSWRRISWKDVSSGIGGSPRRTGSHFYIEFDFASVTGGTPVYIGSFTMDLM